MSRYWMSLLLAAACGCTAAPIAVDAGGDDAGAADAHASPDAGPSRERCDEEGELCCDDATCGAGLACEGGLCTVGACGPIGGPCCAEGFCDGTALCDDGTCVAPRCGLPWQACCTEGAACEDELMCNEGQCVSCGGAGDSCCPSGACDSGLLCDTSRGDPGYCVDELPSCGHFGESCCAGSSPCEAGLGCEGSVIPSVGGTCMPGPACGAERRLCCAEGAACGVGLNCVPEPEADARCQRCGDFDMACCESGAPCGPGLACDSGLCAVAP